jgi:MFS family permease
MNLNKQKNLSDWRSALNIPGLFGFTLFVGMMAAGYYYNLTFVQLGLEDFGTRWLGLSEAAVARDMALLAICTCLIALSFGWWMQRRGLGRQFRTKLRISFGVVLAQTLLTAVIPAVHNEVTFILWLVLVSVALGIGVPVMFSLTSDLVPVKQRGLAAALVTALAYFAAETLSDQWMFEFFRVRLLWVLVGGSLGIGVLAFIRHPWLEALARQHQQPEFALGRFVRRKTERGYRPSRRVVGLIMIMFGIYFVDSLGFLRLLKVPGFMEATWQSPLFSHRLFIAVVHIVGALIAGVLYSALSERQLFFWILGLFALTHLQYTLHIRATGETQATLALPMLYALAVSLYTVVNFAIWADLSTPDTISFNAALGVALSAWTATFISTGLAIYWQGMGLSLERHIQIVDSLAMLFFLAMLVLTFLRKPERNT